MTDKAKILVTRKLLTVNEDRLRADYDATLSEDDHVMSADEVVDAAKGMDALLICVTELLDAAAINRLPDSVQAILTLSVGLDHVDVDAAKARGIAVLNTPDAVTDPTVHAADAGRGAAGHRRGGDDAGGRVEFLDAPDACWHGCYRRDARDIRHGADWSNPGETRAGL
jgi:hypothetical protein